MSVKRFLVTFLAVLALLFGFLLFGGSLFLGSFEGQLGLTALVITVLVLAFESQDRQTEALEARVRALEERLAGGPEPPPEETPEESPAGKEENP